MIFTVLGYLNHRRRITDKILPNQGMEQRHGKYLCSRFLTLYYMFAAGRSQEGSIYSNRRNYTAGGFSVVVRW